jgi:hypothetical protein
MDAHLDSLTRTNDPYLEKRLTEEIRACLQIQTPRSLAYTLGADDLNRFENTLTREEQDILRQWIRAHTWGFTLKAFHWLAEDTGKDCPDPCRLYFEKRDHYYRQEVSSLNA